MKNYDFHVVIFTVLDHFCVLLLFFITFWSIVAPFKCFKGFGKIKKSKIAAV